MRPRILTISPYAAGDPNLVAASQTPAALVALTLTATPFVFDTPRTVLFTFVDLPVDAAIAEDGGVFTDETTEANEATANDMTLFPAVPVAGVDRYNIGSSVKFGRLALNVSTVGTGTYTVVFEYFNGSIFTPLSGVVDGTGNFKNAGLNQITFTIPDDWATTTINSQGPFFYIRAEIQTGTVTAVPLGQQAFLSGSAANNRFLITGQDSKGNELVESLPGAAVALTAESERVFTRIDSILPEIAGTTALEVGTITVVPSPWLPLNYIAPTFQVGLSLIIGGALTPNFDVELTLDNLLDYQGNNPIPGRGQHVGSVFDRVFPDIDKVDHDTLVAVVADATGNIAFPVRAIRLVSNQVFTADTVKLNVVQSN